MTGVRSDPPAAPGEWAQRGACRGKHIDLFYDGTHRVQQQAIDICRTCDVQTECLEWALDHRMDHGIWGGVSERGRRKLLKQRRQRIKEMAA